MTPERRKLRARIEKIRLALDHYEADLLRAMPGKARDARRRRRLAANEELDRLLAQLKGLPRN